MNDAIGARIAAVTAGLTAPRFDIAAIRDRIARPTAASDGPVRKFWWPTIGVVLLPGIVAAAVIFPSPAVRRAIEHQMNAWTAASMLTSVPRTTPQTITFTRLESTSLRDAVRSARFHLILPQGLPKGWSLQTLSADGTGLSYSAEYRTSSGASVTFGLTKVVPHARYVPWVGRFSGSSDVVTKAVRIPTRVWIVGDEVIRVDAAALTQVQAAAVLRATRARPAPLMR
jgi:hypothetical protein